MKIAHFSDTHLGASRYYRLAPGGMNQREQDVADAFDRVIDGVIAERPDVVLVAGDVFDKPRVRNAALLTAVRGFRRLRTALPEAAIIVISGNHDMARTADFVCALQLLTAFDIRVADRAARRFDFPDRGLSVLAVPECAIGSTLLAPNPDARVNLLVAHGEVAGIIAGSRAEAIGRDTIGGFDYAAFGHYHQCTEIAPRTWYSGATEYTSSNPWQEIDAVKGFLVFETDTPDVPPRLVEIPVRRHIDLPRIDGTACTAAELDAKLAAVVAAHDIGGAVVRCIVDAPRDVTKALNKKAIKALQLRALHFYLDCRAPERVRIGMLTPASCPLPDDPPNDDDLIGTEPFEPLPERKSTKGAALIDRLFGGCDLSMADYRAVEAMSREYMGGEDIVAEVAA